MSSSVSKGSSSTKDFNGELSTGIASIPLSFKNCLATFKSEALHSGSLILLKVHQLILHVSSFSFLSIILIFNS